MNTWFKSLTVILILVLLTIPSAFANSFGTNITIPDLISSGTGWYGSQEDQEVEPGCVTGQQWDLEGFFLDGSLLTMVGGYNFKEGVNGVKSGDIFIDIDHNAQYGPSNTSAPGGNTNVNNSFGYDYVIDLDFNARTYDIFSLGSISWTTKTVSESSNNESNPWRYVSGGTKIGDGRIGYQTGLTDALTGFWGGTHNAVTIDLGFLGNDIDNFTAHFTMGCGNDNLMGQTNPVPEPATMLLFGIGLMGAAGLNRKNRL